MSKPIMVNGIPCNYRVLTLDDTERAEEMFSGLEAAGNTVSLKMSNDRIREILGFILVDKNNQQVEQEHFGKLTMPEIAQIIAGFFLHTIRQVNSLPLNGMS